MKFKTTKAAINNNYYYRICIGYADLQNLLHYTEPIAYTCGVYGWNADIYQIENNVCIVTGCRPFGNIRNDYEYSRMIEKQAEKIVCDYKIPYDERKQKLDSLIKQYVKHYINNGKTEGK